jgi:hypothetical protein
MASVGLSRETFFSRAAAICGVAFGFMRRRLDLFTFCNTLARSTYGTEQ